MKRRKIILSIGILLLVAIGFLVVWMGNSTVKVNNTAPATEIVTRTYGLEKELLLREIFYVRHGFRDVAARDLAKEVGIRLECKRQISENQFYYVIVGDYRCFMIVDERDIVQEVLTVKEFPTIEQTEQWLSRDDPYFDGCIIDTMEYGFRELYREIGSSSVLRTTLFTLQDGVMLMQWTGKSEDAHYTYYTDEEWLRAYSKWEGGFVILPVDKQ